MREYSDLSGICDFVCVSVCVCVCVCVSDRILKEKRLKLSVFVAILECFEQCSRYYCITL